MLAKKSKMIFNHETQRGRFEIEIVEIGFEERKEYKDIRIKFSIKVKGDNPNWKIEFSDVRGRIKSINDSEKLIEKIAEEIKTRINQDEQGCFDIGEPILDLTANQKI